jgi:putative FmdB family regulatory protein
MPTYEYRCPTGHQFEHFYRTMSAGESTMTCPECGELAQRKVSGGSGLVFKGSGFYITDYGKDGKKDQRKSTESGKSGDSASGGESASSKSSSEKSSSEKSSSEKSSSEKSSSEKSSTEKPPSKGSGSSDA